MPDDGHFAEIGAALAAAKAKLDGIPKSDFDKLMYSVDMYQGLKRTIRQEYNMQIVTNASLKMYELLSQLSLAACDAGRPRVRAFCNAELPGAFIATIGHYVRTRCPGTALEWLGSSYHPQAAAEDGDRTILGDSYGLYAGNRDRWLMGPRPNGMPEGAPYVDGDLTDAASVAALADAVHARFGRGAGADASGADLYTSDAGIDVTADFNRQEELTAALNFGQVLCGVLSLAPGGALVTKQYTFVTPFSRSLVALLAALFETVDVVKPQTSRPANSEVYLVGRGFRGIGRELAEALLGRLAAYRERPGTTPCDWTPLVEPALVHHVDECLGRAARQIHWRQQVAFLNEAVELYGKFRGNLDGLGRALRPVAASLQAAWLAHNPVTRIRSEFHLVAGPKERSEGEPRGEPRGEPKGEPRGEPRGEPKGEPRGEPKGKPKGEPKGGPGDAPDEEVGSRR